MHIIDTCVTLYGQSLKDDDDDAPILSSDSPRGKKAFC